MTPAGRLGQANSGWRARDADGPAWQTGIGVSDLLFPGLWCPAPLCCLTTWATASVLPKFPSRRAVAPQLLIRRKPLLPPTMESPAQIAERPVIDPAQYDVNFGHYLLRWGHDDKGKSTIFPPPQMCIF